MNTYRKIQRHLSIAILAGLLQPAWGHDAFETTTIAKLEGGNLDVKVTLSQRGAKELLQQLSPASPIFDGSNFNAVKPSLLKHAPGLIKVSLEDAAVPPTDATVTTGDEGDVEFHLSFPRPDTTPFRLHANFLRHLGQGYGGELTLSDDAGRSAIRLLGQDNWVAEVQADLSVDAGQDLSSYRPGLMASRPARTLPVTASGERGRRPTGPDAYSQGNAAPSPYLTTSAVLICIVAASLSLRFKLRLKGT